MKKIRKITAILLALILACSLFIGNAFAVDEDAPPAIEEQVAAKNADTRSTYFASHWQLSPGVWRVSWNLPLYSKIRIMIDGVEIHYPITAANSYHDFYGDVVSVLGWY